MLKFVGKNSLAHISHRPTLFTSLLSAFSATSPHMIVCTAHTTSLLSVTQDGTIIQRDHTLAGPVQRADILTDVSMTGHYVKHWGLVEISVRWFKGILSFLPWLLQAISCAQQPPAQRYSQRIMYYAKNTYLRSNGWCSFWSWQGENLNPKSLSCTCPKEVQQYGQLQGPEHPSAIFFFGSTRYYTIFCNLIRLSHNINDILWLMIGAKFVKKKCEMRDMHE